MISQAILNLQMSCVSELTLQQFLCLLQFEVCQKCFGIAETSSCQPDEFFGTFSTFMMSINDAREDNERIRKQKEEDEKRAQLEEKVSSVVCYCYFSF